MANDTHEEGLIAEVPHINVDEGVAEMARPWRRLQVCKRFLLAMMLLPLTLLAVLPDLVPYTPSGWSSPVVVSTSSSSTIASTVFRTSDYLYANIAVACNDASITTPFNCSLYVDGVLKKTWDTDYLDVGYYTYSLDATACPVGLLSAGTHTITLIADSGQVISESNENNNTYSTTIVVSASGPANDNFSNAATITGLSGATTGSNVNATSQSGEPLLDIFSSATTTVWWKWTAPATGTVTFSTEGSGLDTQMGIYTGSSLSSLSLIHSDDDSGENCTSISTFSCTIGRTYYICVGGFGGDAGAIVLQWSTVVPPPVNDNFAAAITLTGSSGTASGSNVSATIQNTEPLLSSFSHATKTVWWKWTAPATGVASFSTAGSQFDTLMCIYTGSSFTSLVSLQANDDASEEDYTSVCDFPCTSGRTYYICVGGYDGEWSEGAISLRWSIVPIANNDNFANATVISGSSGSITGSSVGATSQSGEPLLNWESTATRTVWWKWTAPANGTATINTYGSSFDTVMGIYTGSSLSSLSRVRENDDYNDLTSSCTFLCTSGRTYYICVGGYGAAGGSVALRWNIAATVYYTICLNKNDGSGAYTWQDCAVGCEDVLPWPGSGLGWNRSGYTFSGWAIAPNSAIPTYANHETIQDIAAPRHAINLYAIWKPNNDYTYRVRFHAMDGSNRIYLQTFRRSESKCLAWLDSEIGWSRPGYIFCGWSDVGSSRVCKYNNGTKVYDLSLTPNGVVDLYAVWLSTTSHRVRYVRNIPDYDELTREHVFWKGTSDTLAWVESQLNWNYKGYTFAGWSRSQTATRPEFTNGQRVQDLIGSGKTVTLYAVWTPNNP